LVICGAVREVPSFGLTSRPSSAVEATTTVVVISPTELAHESFVIAAENATLGQLATALMERQ
jgi:hypothetical protein